MTTTPARQRLRRLGSNEAAELTALLETDFGKQQPPPWVAQHHFMLDALDRGEWDRFVVWPGPLQPANEVAVLYAGPTGTVVVAGDPTGGIHLAEAADRAHWRIIIGDEDVARALLDAAGRSWSGWWRRPAARVQWFMVADRAAVPTLPADAPVARGLRRARSKDLDTLTEFACRLHVEDRMGGAITGSGRDAVRARMADAITRGTSWVVDLGAGPVAKVDLSLRSRRRGAQIAGVYTAAEHRGRGIARDAVALITRELFDDGLPVVTLHVREDNLPALRAYGKAGFAIQARWLLALR